MRTIVEPRRRTPRAPLLQHALWTALVVAPATAQQAEALKAPCIDDARRLAHELDDAVTAGDRDAFVRCFAPTHPEHFAKLLERMTPLLRPGLALERDSHVEKFWIRDASGIALTRAETRSRHPGAKTQPVVEDLLLVFGARGDDVRITLCVEIDPAWLQHVFPADGTGKPAVLQCPACNYALTVGPGWLPVPSCRLRSGCLESYALYSLDVDLDATLSVHLAPDDADPRTMLAALTAADASPRLHGTVSPIADWLPANDADPKTRPTGLRGAQCRVSQPDTRHTTELHLLTYGRVGYLLTVDGDDALLAERRGAIDALVAGFRMRDPSLAPADVAAHVLSGHVGGSFDGASYANDKVGVRLTGPTGWRVRVDAGQYVFDVIWTCPFERGVLRAKGLAPPVGAKRWTRSAADMTLEAALRRDALEIVHDGGWQPLAEDGFRLERSLELRRTGGRPVLLHLALADDLLVCLEGDVLVDEVRATLRSAFATLVRKR